MPEMKKRVSAAANQDNDLTSILMHNDKTKWSPKSAEQKRVMHNISLKRADERRGKKLVSLKEVSTRKSRIDQVPITMSQAASSPMSFDPKEPTAATPGAFTGPASPSQSQARSARFRQPTLSSMTGPTCKGSHQLVKARGMPTTYQSMRGYSIICDLCGTSSLQKESFFYHCPICRFDCCNSCMLGKKTLVKRESDTSPRHMPPEPQRKPSSLKDTSGITFGSDDASTRARKQMNTMEKERQVMSCPTIDDIYSVRGKQTTVKQMFNVGDEVEVCNAGNETNGTRGKVTGFARGRVGVDIGSGARSFMPDQVKKPGSPTKGSSLHPMSYKLGTMVEVCGTGTMVDGRRGIVVKCVADAVDVKLDGDVYRLPFENVTLPIGNSVYVKGGDVNNQKGVITGYNRGRVGVAVAGKTMGFVPGNIRVSTPSSIASRRMDTPPLSEASSSPRFGAPPTPPMPSQQAVKNLMHSIRMALVHHNGPLAFINLRKAAMSMPQNDFGMKQVLNKVGLQDLVKDVQTFNTIVSVFQRSFNSNYTEFVTSLRKRVPEKRERLMLKLFSELDLGNNGVLETTALKKCFIVTNSTLAPSHFFDSATVPQSKFLEYYRDLSAAITNDAHFQTALLSPWRIEF